MGTGTTAVKVPAWYAEYVNSYVAGQAHAFILYGDTNGYAAAGISQRGYLTRQLEAKERIVVTFDRAAGIQFSGGVKLGENQPTSAAGARQQALSMMGLDTPATAPAGGGNDAFAAALASLSAPSAGGKTADAFTQAGGNPAKALPLLEQLVRTPEARRQIAVVINLGDLLLPSADKGTMSEGDRTLLAMLLSWGTDDTLGRCENPIFLVSAKLADLHTDLRAASSGWKSIEMALPDRDARLRYIASWLGDRETRGKALESDLPSAELANLTAGLSLRHLEDILLLGARNGRITHAVVKARKDDIIRTEFSEVAEMIEPLPGGFADLGGMDHLVGWAKDEVIAPVKSGREKDAPKGALLVGPPGTGKTLFVRALAREVGYNAVALRAENVLGGIVGESERKLKSFFAFARALAPVLVFVDEIDQSDMSKRGNSSGNPVASNMFNQMLQFMSDETLRGKVLVVFASNRPDLLDPALLRFGRMDAIIPVLLPDEPARASIVNVQARLQGSEIAPDAALALAAQSVDYSGADIAAVVSKARKLAAREGRGLIGNADVTRALALIRPATPQIARSYTLLAVQACNDAEHLPPQYARLLGNRQELAKEIKAAVSEEMAVGREERSW